MSKKSLAKTDPFLFIFHRGANRISSFNEKMQAWEQFHSLCCSIKVPRLISWGVEGDINWLQDGNQVHLYFLHTFNVGDCIKTVRELLEKEKTGEIFLLKELLANDRLSPHYIIEIKSGIGQEYQALERLIRTVSDLGFSDRVWYDSYSPRVLSLIKKIDAVAITSLHSSLLMGNRVLLTPPGRDMKESLSNVSTAKLGAVPQADIITTFIGPTNCWSEFLQKKVNSFGKRTVFGGLFSPFMLRNAWRSGASGGYIRFNLSSLSLDWISAL
jgi:hypothetical protein